MMIPVAYFFPFRKESWLKISSNLKENTTHSFTEIIWLKLFREILAVYSENLTMTINTKNGDVLVIRAGGTFSNHWAIKR
jgi:hypothetical protein